MKTKKSSIPLSPPSANFRQLAIDLSLLTLVACLIFLYLSGLQIARGVFLGSPMPNHENVAGAVSTPDHQITALISSESCGMRCSCPKAQSHLCTLRASFVNFVVKFWPGG